MSKVSFLEEETTNAQDSTSAGSNWEQLKKTLTPTKKKSATAQDGRGTYAKRRKGGFGGMASYTKNFERVETSCARRTYAC